MNEVAMSIQLEGSLSAVLDDVLEKMTERADAPVRIEILPASDRYFPYRLYYLHEKEYIGGVIEVPAKPDE
jgi:hypothetical protein